MEHRGIMAVGFETTQELLKAIEGLDIDMISDISAKKGFTVRDIDMLIQEMAAHDYYFRKRGKGIAWTNDNFVRVLENSVGSARTESTAELVLGDRYVIKDMLGNVENSQLTLDLFNYTETP